MKARYSLRMTPGFLLAGFLAVDASVVVAAPVETSDCVVTPTRTVELSSPVPGILETVNFDRSDFVRANDVVATLGSSVEQAEVRVATARARMTADVRMSEASLQFDSRNQSRLSSLHRVNAIATLERERAERDADLSKWKLRRARELTAMRKLELERAEAILERKTVRSPIEGFVVRRFKSRGEFVEEQPIVTIAQLDPLRVEAILPLEYFGLLRRGATASVSVEAGSNSVHQAKVTIVDRVADAASGTFGVQLELPNPDYAIPAGIKCRISIEPSARAATIVPAPTTGTPAVHDGTNTDTPHQLQQVPGQPAPFEPSFSKPRFQSAALTSEADAAIEAEMCTAIGPVKKPLMASELAAKLEGLDRNAAVLEHSEKTVTGHMVLAPVFATFQDRRKFIERMREAGINDIAVVPAGQGQTRVSLGLYEGLASAQARVDALKALDVQASVSARTRETAQWWVKLSAPLPRSSVVAVVGDEVGTDCDIADSEFAARF